MAPFISATRKMAFPVNGAGSFSASENLGEGEKRDLSASSTEGRAFAQKLMNALLLLRVFLIAAAVPYLLRLKLTKVAALVEPGSEPTRVDPDRIRKIAAYVETAIRKGHPVVRSGCLTRGLTRYYFLRRAGLDVALHFGMGRVDEVMVGHCWLVKDGKPFLEKEDAGRYVEMYRISRGSCRASVTNDSARHFGKS